MQDYHYSEDEELAKLKRWWKEYGKAAVGGVGLGIAIVAGTNWWRNYTADRAGQASVLYQQVLEDATGGDAAARAGVTLKEKYAATPYAGKAALLLARRSYDRGDVAAAQQQLRWAIEQASEKATAHTARLRLARLLYAAGDRAGALGLITGVDADGFAASYDELRGDLLLADGDYAGAREAYGKALRTLPGGSGYAPVLKMKLAELAAAEIDP